MSVNPRKSGDKSCDSEKSFQDYLVLCQPFHFANISIGILFLKYFPAIPGNLWKVAIRLLAIFQTPSKKIKRASNSRLLIYLDRCQKSKSKVYTRRQTIISYFT